MKKLTAVFLAILMIFAFSATLTVGAADLPTPSIYYDFVKTKPSNGNLDKFTSSMSDRGNIVVTALDGDEETSRIFVFANDNTKFADVQYFVLKFKHLRAEVQAYPGYVNLVGKTAGEEKKVAVNYTNTANDYQTAVLDFTNTFAGDIHYFTWNWHEAARFDCNVEIEYIAAFKTKADADAFAAGYDRHAPAIDTTTEEATVLTTETTASANTTENTPDSAGASSDAGTSPDTADSAYTIAVLLVAATAVIVPTVVERKKKR